MNLGKYFRCYRKLTGRNARRRRRGARDNWVRVAEFLELGQVLGGGDWRPRSGRREGADVGPAGGDDFPAKNNPRSEANARDTEWS